MHRMKTLTEQLARYAEYHRDRRNIATHFVGVPMIVAALAILLSRPAVVFGAVAFSLSPAWLLFGGATIYYLMLDVTLGTAMGLLCAACLALAQSAAHWSAPAWIGSGLMLFVVGWIFQFVGHAAYEHRKPAFADDLTGLVIGPLFVLVEALLVLGWRPTLRSALRGRDEPQRSHRARLR